MPQPAFIADDFGLSEDINQAIVRAHVEGALTGASLMLGQSATAHAIALAREHPTLEVGWHLHLCDAPPVTRATWRWGNSPWRAGLLLGATRANRCCVATELAAQWQRFEATGLRCAFVNGHHHLHVHPVVLRALRRLLPGDWTGWVRGFELRWFGADRPSGVRLWAPLARRSLRRSGFPRSQTLWGLDRTFAMRAGEVQVALATLPAGRHEFVFHPRGDGSDPDLQALMELPLLRAPALPSAPGPT
jgi:predicted glycoside hydrolase/deacetylase ChbG (UPF0249 family)